MTDLNPLEKTNRINLLFDFYQQLLTDKQRTFLMKYYHDDYSLGEIADEYAISRQAVYEHIKRAQTMLLEYEDKLQLLAKHERRIQQVTQIEQALDEMDHRRAEQIKRLLQHLLEID